jgi:hypothetical protein
MFQGKFHEQGLIVKFKVYVEIKWLELTIKFMFKVTVWCKF